MSGIAALLLDAIDASDPLAIVCLATAFCAADDPAPSGALDNRGWSSIAALAVAAAGRIRLRRMGNELFGARVSWRGRNLSVDRTGILAPQGGKEMATT